MESAPLTGVAFIIHTSVESIERMDRIRSVSKEGVPVMVDLGWFVLFQGSHEWLYVGTENPGLVKGDEVEITIRKKTHV